MDESNSRAARQNNGFAAVTTSFVAVFAAGSTSIPLYDTYERMDKLMATDFSIVTVAYFACAVFALLVLGRLSNHLGRRPVTIATLLLGAAGTLTLIGVHGLAPLLIGRVLQGLAAGLAGSAIAAYTVDTAPKEPKWLAATVTTTATTVGLSIGVFGSAVLVEFGPAPRALTYLVFAAILVGCAIAIATRAETVQPNPGAAHSLIPRLTVPDGARRYLPVAGCIFVATWAFGGYATSFGPSVAAGYLHSSSPVIAAAVFASYMAPSVFGGPLTGRISPATTQRLGMILVTIAAVGFVSALTIGNAAVFIIAGILGGLGMGAGMSANMRILLPQAAPAQRAGLLAVIYAMSYLGAAIPSLIAGQLSRSISLLDITIGYGVLAALACVVVLLGARNPVAA